MKGRDVVRVTVRRTTSLAAVVFLLTSCDISQGVETPPALSPIPGPSEIRAIGIIVGESSRDSTTEFRLSDGRVISVDFSRTRQIGQPGGSPAILVLGHDDEGDWVAEVGHQDGTPEGCHVLNQLGYDLGDSIAIAGVRWRTAPGFRANVPKPRLGQPYEDGTRFCLDDMGLVSGLLPADGT
jgi:hypothetical protein